jgi:hypothetical protein
LGYFFAALSCGAVAQLLVWQPFESISPVRQILGWALFALGGFLLARAARAEAAPVQRVRLPFALEAGLLAAVLVFALYVRLSGLGSYPSGCFRDEGENGNVAIQLMNGESVDGTAQTCPAYIEHNTQNAAGYFYPTALFFKLFGISVTSVRYVSVFFGVLSVAAFWALARWFFGPELGIVLAAALAAMRWHLNFSRIGFLGIMSVFLSIPMLVWLYKGLYSPPAEARPARKKRSDDLLLAAALLPALARGFLQFFMAPGPAETWVGLALGLPMIVVAALSWRDRRSRWLMLSSAALAAAMYSYIAARLFVLLVFLIVAHHLLTRQRRIRPQAWTALGVALALAFLGGVILVASSMASPSNAVWGHSFGRAAGLAVVGLGAAALAAFWYSQRDLLRGWVRPLGLALGVGVVVAGPLFAYSVRNQKEVAARSYRVSIFNDEESDKRSWGIKLLENIAPTMGMVNVRGDGNPRHNYPNEPMANPVWAALFALGVFYALSRPRDPRAWLALCLWQISLIAGYASIEAPQAYRCISAIPAVLIFAGLVLERGVTGLKRLYGGAGAPYAWAFMVFLFGVGAALELRTYFVFQPTHPGVWAEFSTGEYLMGQELRALNSNGMHTRGLVRPDWADSYTFRFVTYPDRNYEYFDVSRHIPLRPPESTSGSDFLYILGESYLPLLDVLKGYYPHGVYSETRHPMTNELLYWTYRVSAADAAAAGSLDSGLHADYYQDFAKDPTHPEAGPHWVPAYRRLSRTDPFLLFDWTVSPVPGYFSAEWTGFIEAPQSGEYGFDAVSNSYALLEIDGRKVAERNFLPDTQNTATGRISLSKGRHRIRLRYFEARNYSRVELWWTLPGSRRRQVVPSSAFSVR